MISIFVANCLAVSVTRQKLSTVTKDENKQDETKWNEDKKE